MKVVTAGEMQNIDRRTIDEYGVPSVVLMERAGLAVAQKILSLFERRKVIVICGGGNNGGDGIVVARNLFNWGWNVRVLLLFRENKMSGDCRAQYNIAKKMRVPMEFRTGISRADLHSSLVIDAIFGTGINKPVRPPVSDIVSFLNRADAPVLSVDIPSGISADDGRVMGVAVRADYTVTFGLPKIGHLLHPGAEYAGKFFVEDIGFPRELLASESLNIQTIEKNDASLLIPERPANSHKNDYGHVLIVAGSAGRTGAALMAARACLRSGAGLVTLGVPESLAGVFQSTVTEEMILPLPDKGGGTLSLESAQVILEFVSGRADVLAIGPGIGVSADTRGIMQELIVRAAVPMVIDADGINSISGDAGILEKAKSPMILTPHVGEMARLLRRNDSDSSVDRTAIEAHRVSESLSFSKKTGTYLILKGAPTIIAEPEGKAFINTTGNPGMATAGSGDVLTGIVAAFLGQMSDPLDASVLGTYLHGLAGDGAASEKGMHSMIATDIIEHLPNAFKTLKRG
ncbi:MAG TPA: NAD(P)H-hydrate dehydratase [Candidatus Sulfobium mesophilum]|nr:NAD(P)H-hydrate dehydratase [Candidatus Sulfobium mesophilum]